MPDDLIDEKRRVRERFEAVASRYDDVAVLERAVGDQLIERLDVVRLQPSAILDVGCGTGYCTSLLAKRYRRAQLIGADLAHRMAKHAKRGAGWFSRAKFLSADAERLPFADASFDLIVSNLMLHWCRPASAFAEFIRILRPNGLLVFTSFGPDTLLELRRASLEAAHVPEFIDMHDIGDALVRAGFADPVMDVERYVLTYKDVPALLDDLRARGAVAPASDVAFVDRVATSYAAGTQDGRLPLTHEVVYGHAWVPASRRAADGSVRIPIEKIQRRR